jgi:membrane fusion protein
MDVRINKLFRPEVLENRRTSWLGAIKLQAPRFGWYFMGLGSISIISILSLLLLCNYSRYEEAAGILVPSPKNVTINAYDEGTISRILVREGETVHKGQVLLEISRRQDLGQPEELHRQQMALGKQVDDYQSRSNLSSTLLSIKPNEYLTQHINMYATAAGDGAGHAIAIRASVDGVIANILTDVGRPSSNQQPLISILPTPSEMIAELWVPARVAGIIQVGDRVLLKYDGYPYQEIGKQFGRISSISVNPKSDEESGKLVSGKYRGKYYRVLVSLDEENISVYGRVRNLRLGMSLEADLFLDKHRLIDWVIYPVHTVDDK